MDSLIEAVRIETIQDPSFKELMNCHEALIILKDMDEINLEDRKTSQDLPRSRFNQFVVSGFGKCEEE